MQKYAGRITKAFHLSGFALVALTVTLLLIPATPARAFFDCQTGVCGSFDPDGTCLLGGHCPGDSCACTCDYGSMSVYCSDVASNQP